eukprot:TRINITY_DN3167_c0_g1_i1.p5 TRINITY_DN3167_c0_g1~~TRINITY_DN3167_c0_g1_i1.p5  ORF type:complete len:205 (+),score=9.04 TRINITY_DN3167_c0_g1_i1:2393-3007(+)
MTSYQVILSFIKFIGVSVGALNAFLISLYPPGEERRAADHMGMLWKNVEESNVYNINLPELLMHRKSLYSNTPLKKYINNQIAHSKSNALNRGLSIGTVNIADGIIFFISILRNAIEVYVYVNNSNVQFKDWPDYLAASAAIPFAFLPQYLNGTYYVDGGLLYNLNIQGIIDYCYSKGTRDSDIIIDYILTNKSTILEKDLPQA